MASTSCVGNTSLSMKDSASSYSAYPLPLAKYEEVVDNPQLFMFTLEKLHAAMGTKFMIPIVGGRELDLHRLFVEVSSRGGIAKIRCEDYNSHYAGLPFHVLKLPCMSNACDL